MTEVKRGMPSVDEVLSLLNSAYDGWGDEDYFEWKYDEYPDYGEDEHVFYIESEGEVVAFRRLFLKELVCDGKSHSVFVAGDTAVGPDQQGQGYYSCLRSRTNRYIAQTPASLQLTFNRSNGITYQVHRDEGWGYRTLPLWLRILSPSTVIKQYADRALESRISLKRLLAAMGTRFAVSTSDGTVTPAEIAGQRCFAQPSMTVPVSDATATSIVEAASAENSQTAVSRLVSRIARRTSSGVTSQKRSTIADDSVDIKQHLSLSNEDHKAILSLYRDPETSGVSSFRREKHDLSHLTQYPEAETFIARRNGSLTGFAVLGPRQQGNVTEGRILELVYKRDNDLKEIIRSLERRSIARNFDLILLITKHDPGSMWAKIDRQVLMWGSLDGSPSDDHPIDPAELTISLYDVV